MTFHPELVLTPEVEVEIQIERLGNSSFVLHGTAHQNAQVAAEARVVYIHVGADHRPTPHPAELRAYLDEHGVSTAM